MSSRRSYGGSRSGGYNFDLSSGKDKEIGIQLSASQTRLKHRQLLGGQQPKSASTPDVSSSKSHSESSSRPFETRSNKSLQQQHYQQPSHSIDETSSNISTYQRERPKINTARSTASTTVYSSQHREDQKALLRKVLAKKAQAKNGGAKSTASGASHAISNVGDRRDFLKKVILEKGSESEHLQTSSSKSTISTSATSNNHVSDQKAILRKVLAKSRAKKNIHSTEAGTTPVTKKKIEAVVELSNREKGSVTKTEKAHHTVAPSGYQPSSNTKSRLHSAALEIKKPGPVIEMMDMKKNENTRPTRNSSGLTSFGNVYGRSNNSEISQTQTQPERIRAPRESVQSLPVNATRRPDVQSTSRHSIQPLTKSTEENDDEKGYREFLQTLQKELASDHTELWRGFQCLFYKPGDMPARPREKPKRVKFDTKTKEVLTKMNIHLKQGSSVECVAETQLVNDRKVAKEARRVSYEAKSNVVNSRPVNVPEARKSFATRERLESARKQVPEKETSSRSRESIDSTFISQRKTTTQSRDDANDNEAIPENRDVDVKPNVSDWPQEDEGEQELKPVTQSEVSSNIHNAKQKSKIESQMELQQPKKQTTTESTSNETEPNAPERSRNKEDPLIAEAYKPEIPVKGADKQEEKPRVMPWMVALQERKARMKAQGQKESKIPEWPPNPKIKPTLQLAESTHGNETKETEKSSQANEAGREEQSPSPDDSNEVTDTGREELNSSPYESNESMDASREDQISLPDESNESNEGNRSDNTPETQVEQPRNFDYSVGSKKTAAIAEAIEEKPRLLPWMVALQERKARIAAQGVSESGVSSVSSLSMARSNATTKVSIADLGSLQVDTSEDDNKDVSNSSSPLSPGSLSGRKRRIPSEPNANETLTGKTYLPHQNGTQEQESTKNVAPWAVKLRPVGSKSLEDQKSTASTSVSTSVPFRQMLKRVPSEAIRNKTSSSGATKNDISDVPDQSEDFRNTLKKSLTKKETPLDEEAYSEEKSEDISSTIAPKNPIAISLKPQEECGIKIGDKIDLDNLPTKLFEENEKVLTMSLERTAGMSKTDKVVALVGKKIILTARSADGSPNSTVIWRVLREQIDSLTLDMADNRAALALKNRGTKSLAFETAQDCLNFANAFYMTKTLQSEEEDNEKQRDSSVTKLPVEVSPSVIEQSLSSSSLSEEEKQLLEQYRKIRLSKSPDEAMQHVVSNSIPDLPKSLLTEEEEKVASKYRKMLKMRVPPESVQHKMTMERCSSKIIDSVLGVKEEKTMPESSPASSLSEEDEKIASKFRKMLKMRVPPDAVRHKMNLENCSTKIVDSVLGTSEISVSPQDQQESKSGLSEEEEKIASGYRKMLKMRVPAEAVRHKMQKEKVDAKIAASVLGEDPPEVTSKQKVDSLSADEEKIASKFRKMLKMRIPEDAVRHKMTVENIDKKILAAVLGPDPSTNGPSENESKPKLSAEEEKTASSFRKMLKMMVPPEAVRHKMKKENVNAKIIEAVLGVDNSAPPKKKVKSLSDDEERIASRFRKMLKMNIPKGAVRNKMVNEGVNSKIVAAVLGENTEAMPPKPGRKSSSKLVSLHWTPLSDDQVQNSIWNSTKKRKVSAGKDEVSQLCELFQKKTNKGLGKGSKADKSDSDGKGEDMAKLIDLTRANNVAISLKAFKEFSYKEFSEIIANLDPKKKILGERCQFIRDLLPNQSETKIIKSYKGSDSRLIAAELWFKEIAQVQRVETKVQIMQTMDNFKENASALREKFAVLGSVCTAVMGSEKLQDVLELVLQVGNIMNEGTRTGGAVGFKFDSLLKLTQTKSSDGKTTVLDYLVMVFIAKNKRQTLNLLDEFPEVETASRMVISDMTGDVRELKQSLERCKKELVCMKSDQSERPVTRSMSKKFAEGKPADPRAGLLGAIKAMGSSEDSKDKDPRSAFLAAIQEKNNPDDAEEEAKAKATEKRERVMAAIKKKKEAKEKEEKEEKDKEKEKSNVGTLLSALTTCGQLDDVCSSVGNDATSTASSAASIAKEKFKKNAAEKKAEAEKDKNPGGTHATGVLRLEAFTDEAVPDLESLEETRDHATKACKDLAVYCGESGGERAGITVLGILSEFVTNLKNGLKKYDDKEEAKKRKEAAEKKRQSLDPKTAKPANKKNRLREPEKRNDKESVPKKGASLVLMVNDMLKSAPDDVKENFAKGVVEENTSDQRLKRIYEREQESSGGRESMLHDIKKLRSTDEAASNHRATAFASVETNNIDSVGKAFSKFQNQKSISAPIKEDSETGDGRNAMLEQIKIRRQKSSQENLGDSKSKQVPNQSEVNRSFGNRDMMLDQSMSRKSNSSTSNDFPEPIKEDESTEPSDSRNMMLEQINSLRQPNSKATSWSGFAKSSKEEKMTNQPVNGQNMMLQQIKLQRQPSSKRNFGDSEMVDLFNLENGKSNNPKTLTDVKSKAEEKNIVQTKVNVDSNTANKAKFGAGTRNVAPMDLNTTLILDSTMDITTGTIDDEQGLLGNGFMASDTSYGY